MLVDSGQLSRHLLQTQAVTEAVIVVRAADSDYV